MAETTGSAGDRRFGLGFGAGFGWAEVILAATVVAAVAGAFYYRQRAQKVFALAVRSPLPAAKLADRGPDLGNDAYRKDYEFRSDWFTKHIPVWRKACAPYAGRPDVRYLEVGVWEGRSALWVLENVLTDPSSRAVIVDPFFHFGTEERWRANVEKSGASPRVETIKGLSGDALPGLKPSSFDIIYIDGSHATADVLSDAVLAWRLLKPGGLLIFDDYRWTDHDDPAGTAANFPHRAIDEFCKCYAARLEVVHNDFQVMVRKHGR